MKASLPAGSPWAAAAGALALAALAVFMGLLASTGSVLLVVLVTGALIGIALLALPLSVSAIVLLAVTFLVQGLLTYFGRMQQAAWLPYLLALLLFVRVILPAPLLQTNQAPLWSRGLVVFIGLYIATVLGSTFVNAPPMAQVIVGLKNALPFWLAAFVLYRAAQEPDFQRRAWALMTWVFAVQVPLVVYQHLVIVPSRRDAATTGMDAVVGSFGGLIEAGGANATLALFSLVVVAYYLARWMRGVASGAVTALVCLAGLGIIVAGEVKAVLIWIPLVSAYVLRARIFKSFVAALGFLMGGALFLVALFTAYDALYWQNLPQSQRHHVTERFEYFFDPRNIDYRTGEVSRGASLALWEADPGATAANRIIGYGPAASRISATGGLGEVARRYAPLSLGATTLAVLLWDSGVLGALAFGGILLLTLRLLHRHSRDASLDPADQSRAEALAAGMLMMITLVFYNRSLTDEPSTQLLLALAVACALYWQRWPAGRPPHAAARPAAHGMPRRA